MKVVYLITGSGGSFYCSNCYRDMLYVRAIRKVPGVTANAIPLYLPPDTLEDKAAVDSNVFFGAISLFLREKVKFLRNMPAFLDKIFDSAPLLKIAASRAGSTRTEGLEDLTLDMIRGDNKFREKEMDRLVAYLIKTGKPDIIHLSNALIIGLAYQLKKRLPDLKVVCSLQNEDDWINEMAEPFQTRAWEMIAEESVNIDAFVSPSSYYKDFFINRTGVSGDKIALVQSGFEALPSVERVVNDRPPAIGYFSRVNHHNGFDKMADAFIKLKSGDEFPDLTLHVCGGFTGDDKPFIRDQIQKIKDHGYKSSVRIYPEFVGNSKQEFFSNIDLMSVPVRKYDAYGLYILEANSSEVPVVQPDTGSFPEILEKTGGGIIYKPDNVEELATSIGRLLNDRELREKLGRKGNEMVRKEFTTDKMAAGLSALYNRL